MNISQNQSVLTFFIHSSKKSKAQGEKYRLLKQREINMSVYQTTNEFRIIY